MIPSSNNFYKTIYIALFKLSLLLSIHSVNANQNVANPPQNFQEQYGQKADPGPQVPANIANQQYIPKTILNIIISGNKLVDTQAILNKIPYKIGEKFDPRKTRQLIHNLYFDLKRIRDVKLLGELVGADGLNLHVKIKEKHVLKEIKFLNKKGKVISEELDKKINLQEIPALDQEELKRLELIIKNVYSAKNFHQAIITSELKVDTDGRAIAIFNVEEGPISKVKRICFVGNENISGRELKKLIFTREDWILGILDGAGSLQKERLESDKHLLEQYYQSEGYMKAKVTKADVDMDPETKNFTVTFHIKEDDLYKVKSVKAPGNDILKDEYLVSRLPIKPEDFYSRKKIIDAIKALELMWGDLGYVFAHIEPSIQPNDEDNTVDIAFYAELGEKIFLNKINIIGNKKTKDKVIRRKIMMREGELITNRKKELSKYGIESLGYFDPRDGVNWKITRLDKNTANLDLILKEVKTGHAGIKLGFGGSVQSLTAANSGFSLSGELNDTNLFGTGMTLSLNATLAKGEQNIIFNITDPWLFDMPITGALDIYHKRPTYGEFRNLRPVHEKTTGGGITLGFVSPRLYNSQILFRFGGDKVRYETRPEIMFLPMDKRCFIPQYQKIIDRLFVGGSYFWFETHVGQDRKNHPMHTSKGYKWNICSKFGIPSLHCNIGYFKMDFDFNWYTALIGVNDLVLRFHTYFGYVKKLRNKYVPYRELFHIGGPASVRGFLFGQVGPQFCGDSIGGSKAFFTNVELVFPITHDFNIKGVAFYDGGTGWDNPYTNLCPSQIEKNTFNYRHAVGFGFRMMNPVPVRVDWGFKLDRRKKWNETPSEVHFGMTYDW